jgi:RNA polymerase sigma-70 factor (ECF subfamily)
MIEAASNTAKRMTPAHEQRVEEFMRLFSGCERKLYDFVLVLVGNLSDADEVIQEAVLRLWRNFDKFESGTDFGAWARTVVYHQVIDFYRDTRNSSRQLSPAFFEAVAAKVAEQSDELEARKRALEVCLQKLSASDRDVVMRCYDVATPVKNVAESIGRTSAATYQLLWRIRTKLYRCIERQLRSEAS